MLCATLQVTDHDASGRPTGDDLAVLSAPLSDVVTQELDGASAALGVTVEDVLLAALGRTIERTIGEGVLAVDVTGYGGALQPVMLSCAGPQRIDASQMLAGVHHTLASLSTRLGVQGVPEDPNGQPVSDVLFVYGTAGPVGLGQLLEVHAYRNGDVVVLDWWYDTRSFDPYTIEELSEQFPYGLIELTSEAAAPALPAAELAMAH
jgi:hypothetical protein